EGYVDAGRVAAHEVALERRERVFRYLDVGERAEPGVDAVRGGIARGMPLDDGTRGVNGARRARIERDRLEPVRHRFELFERQRASVECDHGMSNRILRLRYRT